MSSTKKPLPLRTSVIWKHHLPREAIALGLHRTALSPENRIMVFVYRGDVPMTPAPKPRRMSFALTIDQILARTKTVTRRTGWHNLRAGDELIAVDKARGVKHSAQRVLARLRVVSVDRAPLDEMLVRPDWSDDPRREGFPDMLDWQFVEMFCKEFKCEQDIEVTRIEFEYLPEIEA